MSEVLRDLWQPGLEREQRDALYAALLRARIEKSGLSARRFAREVLLREDRTVRRWIARDSPVPLIVGDWLLEPKAMPWPK
ncbi:hypothetical protein [Gaopeijia maritima]|uniref:hypothetical protein n=1 Tax=Gaopeijia maritima TaxID=3119007 RepID=UPI003281ABF4